MKIGVVLCNLGGPRNLNDVQPFLYRLFMDEEVVPIQLKGWSREIFAYLVSHWRAKKTRKKYAKIGGSSPINENTEKQRTALSLYLNQNYHKYHFEVATAMRFSFPNAEQALEYLQEKEVKKIVLLPLYPHYCYSTGQSSIDTFQKVCQQRQSNIPVLIIKTYHTHPRYVQAVNQKIDEEINKLKDKKNTVLVFSAHGIPVRGVRKGDPYQKNIEESIQAIMQARNFDLPYRISYQSRVGPMEWLKPYTQEVIQELAKQKINNVIIIPISFVSDHLETLYEIGIEYAQLAQKMGIPYFTFTNGLNDSPLFIQALAELIYEVLKHTIEQD
ncbi:MAG: ferrochelatase [Bacteroidia bacterium]|nr:ferrochelatase [Bacteroidia bacterium]MDW8345992.1 ferrochelatase [Bacteroidia bacterium]